MVPKKTHQQTVSAKTLRERAEMQIRRSNANDGDDITIDEMKTVLHELNVHQVEMELQNEELRQAQLDLAHSRDRFASLYNQAPVGYLTIDRDGMIRDANQTAAEMLGVGQKQLVQSKIWNFIDRESRDNIYLGLRATMSGSGKHTFEAEMQRADQSNFHGCLECSGVDLDGEHCTLTGLIDISQRKLAENATSLLNINLQQSLSKTESDLRDKIKELNLINTAVKNLQEGIMITGDGVDWPHPTIIFANPAMSHITGYDNAELVGSTPAQMQCDCNDSKILEEIASELRANRAVTVELRQCHKDGTIFDTETSISPLLNEQGHRTHFVSIHRDINQRNLMERALREKEARLSAILDTAAEAIITTDTQGIIERCNAKTESMFGYSANEMLGNNVSMLMPSPFKEEHNDYLLNHLETGFRQVIGRNREAIAQHKNGTIFPILISISELKGLNLYAGFIQDLTDIKALQREVLDAAAQEDRRIGQELHDNIQQQLTGLGLLASGLKESIGDQSSEVANTVARLEGGIGRALDQLKSLSRGLIPVDVDAAGLGIALELLTKSIYLGEEAECRFLSDSEVLIKDNNLATHLYRIAQEAVNNVIKHSRATRLDIKLTGNGERLTLEIEDNGLGSCRSYQEESGLGLRMMRYRAQLIGAQIYVGPGSLGGTRVRCTLESNVVTAGNPPINQSSKL
jgi:two-component system CheB/CheR fusion protein